MAVSVSVQTVQARKLAVVTREVALGAVASAFRPALHQVWNFLRTQTGLRTDGPNVFLYHHSARRSAPMNVDFRVEVTRTFEPSGEVHAAETPAGEVAAAMHVGPYEKMRETHDAIHAWTQSHGRAIGGQSWEVYGDWSDDPAKLETTIFYFLR
jgi:effector-binding domain-containing protein